MTGGAVARDGRISPGDMILQVNEVNFQHMSNDEAVKVLREVVQKPGPIRLVVAKCWDQHQGSNTTTTGGAGGGGESSSRGGGPGRFNLPSSEPVRPIDPGAWVAHIEAVRGEQKNKISITFRINFPIKYACCTVRTTP